MVTMSNGEIIVPNNDYDTPMLNGDAAPILSDYVPPSNVVEQVALAWIE